MVTLSAPNAQDCVALAEIELCGELMIAASATREERLSPDRIDEVLDVRGSVRADVRGDVRGDVRADAPCAGHRTPVPRQGCRRG
ncbi:hypothetical protein [Streptomyces sp. BE147]|uniref:hypothetical protein n=1 Tax=unclassified Streptomyces TaxID=2593676 RepID=UPI002E782D5F|nr:hypothetical protein [Streptomyces sp. BE147]MEE1737311.1 hypothetical protein [Streptomyces sp. BE147]